MRCSPQKQVISIRYGFFLLVRRLATVAKREKGMRSRDGCDRHRAHRRVTSSAITSLSGWSSSFSFRFKVVGNEYVIHSRKRESGAAIAAQARALRTGG
jgi:hypothetical protein